MTIALPELTHWRSKTTNGGRTTVIASTSDAVAIGFNYVRTMRANQVEQKQTGVTQVKVTTRFRDSNKARTKTINLDTWHAQQNENLDKYETAAKEVTLGNPETKHIITELAAKLMTMALELQPTINSNYCGFERWEDGDEVLVDLLHEGDDRPFLRRKVGDVQPRAGKGEGAYRIIINTDVSWWGTAEMNAAVMGAMVMCLQQFAPVEIWIQQGWLGQDEDDGVSLFKLDFNGNFDPTQLSFWCGSPLKDNPFSLYINKSIGRVHNKTSTAPELPCDLYLRGGWMTLGGIDKGFETKTPDQQNKLAAEWIAKTCNEMLFSEEAEMQT